MTRVLPQETPFHSIPYPGCAATIPVGSDCYPATVVWVSDQSHRIQDDSVWGTVMMPKRIRVQQCEYRGVEGHSNAFTEDQRYVYYSEGDETSDDWVEYSYRPQLRGYVRVGTPSRSTAAQRLVLGFRRAYRDPSF